MNALQIKVIETTPAEVNFNYDEISKHLDGVLKQYTGIIVTENTISEGKKIIAELRKGQKSLDEFRKQTKKALTASVTEFEDRCKELSKKFDEVINPINEQAEQFELKRKEEKRVEVQKIIDDVCKLKGLESLPMEESYLNKSTSLKSIKAELIKVTDGLLLEQATLKANTNVIKSKIELVNAKYDLKVVDSPYVKMLEYTDLETILAQVEKDAESLKKKDVSASNTNKIVQAPTKNEEIYTETYEIEGTESQLDILEEFLNKNNYTWSVE